MEYALIIGVASGISGLFSLIVNLVVSYFKTKKNRLEMDKLKSEKEEKLLDKAKRLVLDDIEGRFQSLEQDVSTLNTEFMGSKESFEKLEKGIYKRFDKLEAKYDNILEQVYKK